jgi:Bifunctional DNA primase/polymerase, N-terminal/Primase C terminal 1 (PriCT-1)
VLSIEQNAEGETVAVRPTPTATVAWRGRGSTDLTQLLQLLARGWRVFPCRMHDKKPLLRDWPTHASSDSEQIVSWNQQWPDCNWACATGVGSGVFVLDVDGQSGEASLKLLPGELPTTLTTKTGRGFHFWFQWPNGCMIRNSTGELGEGLDIRGEGGYVMVPPSMHPSGKRYEFTVPEDIAVPPQWLVDAISAPLSQPYPSDQGVDLIEPGRRNSTLASMAGAMRRRGMTPQAIEAALLAENAARCHPPLAEAEVREIARSVSRYAPAPKPQNPELETAPFYPPVLGDFRCPGDDSVPVHSLHLRCGTIRMCAIPTSHFSRKTMRQEPVLGGGGATRQPAMANFPHLRCRTCS